MSGLARRGGQAGFTAAEFVLGVCVIVVPVALLVLALPTWSERQSMAQRAANESAREVVLADSWSAGTSAARAVVEQVAGNFGVPLDQVRGPDFSAGGGLAPGQTVVARVTDNVWASGGFAGSTVKGSTGGRVGVTFGW